MHHASEGQLTGTYLFHHGILGIFLTLLLLVGMPFLILLLIILSRRRVGRRHCHHFLGWQRCRVFGNEKGCQYHLSGISTLPTRRPCQRPLTVFVVVVVVVAVDIIIISTGSHIRVMMAQSTHNNNLIVIIMWCLSPPADGWDEFPTTTTPTKLISNKSNNTLPPSKQ